MDRIIAGCRFVRDAEPYAHDLKIHDLGRGQVEAVILPRHAWREADISDQALADYEMCVSGHMWRDGGWVPYEAGELPQHLQEQRALENRERATRRARTKVRRLAKFKQLETMLTLTYRENMLDRERIARDVDVFLKRVRRAVPGFEYICVFERQKRGCWHAHLAVKRILSHYVHRGVLVKSYDVLRSMWRAVVGQDNGNIDVSRRRRLGRSTARLASYLSKYIGKTFDQAERYVNSYSASGRALPGPVTFRVTGGDSYLAIALFNEVMAAEFGTAVSFHAAALDCGAYFMCIDPG